jgi:YHS domain-containing protein
MARVRGETVQGKDPVCGMVVDVDATTDRIVHQDVTYVFCSAECRERFEAAPERYVRRLRDDEAAVRARDQMGDARPSARGIESEPPFTVDPMPAPKFGAAGSGGLEYEAPPPRRGRPRR